MEDLPALYAQTMSSQPQVVPAASGQGANPTPYHNLMDLVMLVALTPGSSFKVKVADVQQMSAALPRS